MRIHLVNPSDVSFGTAVITPRWQYVLAAVTPERYGTPRVVDETLEPFDPESVNSGDVVGIGIHTANALRGYQVGGLARARGAFVIFGGIHASLFPEEVRERGGAHAVVVGDGDIVWARVLEDCEHHRIAAQYRGWPCERRVAVGRAMGSAAGRSLHACIGADRSRVSEALLLLFRMANRRTEAASAQHRIGGQRDRCAPAAGISIHRARG